MGALGSAAATAPGAIRELFEAIDRKGMPAMKGSGRASIGFRLGPAGDWLVEVENGRLRVQQSFETADCVIETDEETLLGILRGQQNARTATLAGRVKVTGDFDLASRFGRMTAGAAQVETRPEVGVR
jgi:putative sterol carrier protein